MEPVQDVEKVPKQRWKLVSVIIPIFFITRLTSSDLLYMPTTDGSVRAVWKQKLLPSFSRHLR
jgi:hypothetical protein